MPRGYTCSSKVVAYPGMGGWRFLAIAKKTSEQIKKKFGAKARGWGSIRVTATIGKTSWDTSIFPDKKSGCYVLPLKAKVRNVEEIDDEDTLTFSIRIRTK